MKLQIGNKRLRKLSCVPVSLIVCIILPFTTSADADWEWVNPWPQGHNLVAAEVGNGLVVAVGRQGSIVTSSDGPNWQVVHVNTEYWLADVAWGNGRFVAVGGAYYGWEGAPGLGVVLSSDDGFHWAERHRTESHTFEAIHWNGSVFVAVGIGGVALTSSDGESWTEHQLEDEMWYLWDLDWTGSEFVAVGLENAIEGRSSIFFSPDGITWQRKPFEPSFTPLGITFEGNRYVVVGGRWLGRPYIATSEDGLTWDEVSWEVEGIFTDVVFANDMFLAVGQVGQLATSYDGVTWSLHERISAFDTFGIAWTGNEFLAVGEDGFMAESAGGTLWSPISSKPLDLHYSVDFSEFVKGGSLWVGVGDGGIIITSPNGLEWTERQSPAPSSLTSVIWSGASFWAVGRSVITRSKGGVHWASMLVDSRVALFDIAWSGSLYVAVGWNPSSADERALAISSSDGQNWDYHWMVQRGPLRSVEWADEQFVAVGAHGAHFTSKDGLTWQQREMDELISVKDMAWNGDRLVAVGSLQGEGPLVLTSQDGNTWENRTPPDTAGSAFSDVTWTGTHFVAVGHNIGDRVFASLNGITWSSEPTGTGLLPWSVGGDERQIFVFGSGGKFIRHEISPPPPRRPTGRVWPIDNKWRSKDSRLVIDNSSP